jgi:sulfur-oxidizing protein SoxB
MGNRIRDLALAGKPIEAQKNYKVAGWAPVGEGVTGEPIWEVVETYLKAKKSIAPPKVNLPKLLGVEGDPGIGT